MWTCDHCSLVPSMSVCFDMDKRQLTQCKRKDEKLKSENRLIQNFF